MSSLPHISIITPVHNAAHTLEACIESVANQNYPYLEHWLIDGLSTDSTVAIIKSYQKKYPHIRYISEKDEGIYDAMNKGIKLSGGEFLYFLGADDVLYDHALLSLFDSVKATEFDIIYGRVHTEGRVFGNPFDYEDFCKQIQVAANPIIHDITHHQGTFIHRTLFEQYGVYDTSRYPIGADVYFFLRILANRNLRIYFKDLLVARFGQDGTSSHKEDMEMRKDYPDLVKHHFGVVVPYKIYYRTLAKYYFEKIYKGNVWEGLREIVKIAVKTRDYFYYITHTVYWLKERFQHS